MCYCRHLHFVVRNIYRYNKQSYQFLLASAQACFKFFDFYVHAYSNLSIFFKDIITSHFMFKYALFKNTLLA